MAAGEYFAFRRQDIDIPQAPQWITLFKRDGRLFERLSGRVNRQQPFRPAGGSQCSLLPDSPAILFCQRVQGSHAVIKDPAG